MDYKIRHENPEDYHKTELVTREAFWNLYKPGCEEHFIVHSMRSHPDFLPQLSFVMERQGKIVGSIFYTKTKIIDECQKIHHVITFGPVSIQPALHRRGLGKMLITHSINEAKKLGYNAIIIGGYPYHYHVYGFESTKKFGISMPDGAFYTGIMALPLYDKALESIKGHIEFSDCFEVNESEVEIFDKNFPFMEKKVLSSQLAFENAAIEIDLS